VDNRPEAVAQKKLLEMTNNSPQAEQAVQLQAMADNYSARQKQRIPRKDNSAPVTIQSAGTDTGDGDGHRGRGRTPGTGTDTGDVVKKSTTPEKLEKIVPSPRP
jgi:hypothetical protein